MVVAVRRLAALSAYFYGKNHETKKLGAPTRSHQTIGILLCYGVVRFDAQPASHILAVALPSSTADDRTLEFLIQPSTRLAL